MSAPLRFLVDVGVGTTVENWAAQVGHDVVPVRTINPHAADGLILDLAVQENRIIVTMDKDFVELVFRSGRPHGESSCCDWMMRQAPKSSMWCNRYWRIMEMSWRGDSRYTKRVY